MAGKTSIEVHNPVSNNIDLQEGEVMSYEFKHTGNSPTGPRFYIPRNLSKAEGVFQHFYLAKYPNGTSLFMPKVVLITLRWDLAQA